MPGFNKTGPLGQGSMTGRGLGTCNTNKVAVNNSENNEETTTNTMNNNTYPRRNFNGAMGCGFRGGRGRGRGRGFAGNGRGIRGNF
ncbi:MAG: DUF5320 domain-containing protein [Pleomorphochaeta sp.]|nr:DUF5320 domain-containing protein [Sphaerochaetaceae bacterium]